MQSRSEPAGSGRTRNVVAGRGIFVVFRHQMRARCPVRDLIWMGVLVLCYEAIAAGLQFSVMPAREYSGDPPALLHRWMSMASLAGPLLFLPLAAALGALSVPPVSRFEETQSMLLTRLTPLDLCAGRLFAGLWPLIAAILSGNRELVAWLLEHMADARASFIGRTASDFARDTDDPVMIQLVIDGKTKAI